MSPDECCRTTFNCLNTVKRERRQIRFPCLSCCWETPPSLWQPVMFNTQPHRSVINWHSPETTAIWLNNAASYGSIVLSQLLDSQTRVCYMCTAQSSLLLFFFCFHKIQLVGDRETWSLERGRRLTFCCWNCSFSFCVCFFRELFSCCRVSICNEGKVIHCSFSCNIAASL